jgi:F-type H+-transporting ATPase subunit b
MTTAIVTQLNGRVVQVRLTSESSDTTVPAAEDGVATEAKAMESGVAETTVAATKSAPNPIAPESKELYWAAGSFIVLFVLMRYFLFPKLKKGMDARYEGIRADIDGAVDVKASAQSDVAEYEKALAAARAEAATKVDAARQAVDAERNKQLAEVNGRIAAARSAADQQNAAARAAAQGEVAAAVAQVASKGAELATGRTPDAQIVQAAVQAAMESAVSR